jgi:hypothetical protein
MPPADAPMPTTGNTGEADGVGVAPDCADPGSEDVVVVMRGRAAMDTLARLVVSRRIGTFSVHRPVQRGKQKPREYPTVDISAQEQPEFSLRKERRVRTEL